MQIYVASFSLLQNVQLVHDAANNSHEMSEELSKMFQSAQRLLCEIEGLINATSAQKIGSKDWIKRKEMREILTFQNLSDMVIHRIYVKGSYQSYIKRLENRVLQQSSKDYVEKKIIYPKHKALGSKKAGTRRPNKGGRKNHNNIKRQQQRLQRQQNQQQKQQLQLQMQQQQLNEISTTKRIHIVRKTKTPGQQRKNNNRMNARRRQKNTKVPVQQQQQSQQKKQ